MTVCIAALCDGGQSCVVASDREITVGFPMNIGFEHHERKIDEVTAKSVILSSGNALVAAEVIKRASLAINAAGIADILQCGSTLRDTYMTLHMERAEQVFLRPRGLTLQEFKDIGAQKIPPVIYQAIDGQFWNFCLNTDFILAGVDASGGHIGWVHYQGVNGGGWLEWFDKHGFQAIGSGGAHAAILLCLNGQHKNLSIAHTVYNVLSAKTSAEVAPGVGPATDMAIITKDGIEYISDSDIEKLKNIRRETYAKLATIPKELEDMPFAKKSRKEA